MKLIKRTLLSIANTFTYSATPFLFGGAKRKHDKLVMADEYKNEAGLIANAMKTEKTKNPFETAAAKSAMAASSRKAKQTQERFANIMGGNANPESIIAAQQATQEAISGTAGDIAVGSQAQKQATLNNMAAQRSAAMNNAAQLRQSAINETGKDAADAAKVGRLLFTGGIGASKALSSSE